MTILDSSIDAVATSERIKSSYRRYLQSLLAVRNASINAALRTAIDETPMLDKGPYLEATPPYAPGASLTDLINDGVLAEGFGQLGGPALPLDRPLYVHQEESIRKVASGRNVVVATGTGSGKTESFLLPILNSLVREHERGELGPGVRALLLYPMNALANDQMKRLRQLLVAYPQITFGRYTGDTESDPSKAREMFAELNIGEPMLPNELLSRQEMRATPPHLLLTNYAMLEYLLLRPLDMDLFASGEDSRWRFIVVDEAHVYDGSKGAEIAMLLRRVRDRVAASHPIQCIATSATVGSDASAVTQFAENLFGEPFEWDDHDRDRQDLITAKRVAVPSGPFWGPQSAGDYVSQLASGASVEAAKISHEQSLATLRRALSTGPLPFDEAARIVFGDDPAAGPGLAAMVALASAARFEDGTTALSARYHLFLRAAEGAFTCLAPTGPHVRLAPHATCPEPGCQAPTFEIGSCKRCGAVHVVGTPTPEGGYLRLAPRKSGSRGTWLLLGQPVAAVDEDEDAVEDTDVDLTNEDAALCASCGVLCPGGVKSCPNCHSSLLRTVRKLKTKGTEIAGCLTCGARGAGTVRLFDTGADASSAVITTTLYQSLPPSHAPHEGHKPGEGRKLLAFSDSRQSAAYFAPYLSDSYERLQRRRLVAQALVSADADEEPLAVEDLVFEVRRTAKEVNYFPGGMTSKQEQREIAPWIMAEMVATDDRQSLEGLGMTNVRLWTDPSWQAPRPLLDLGLDEQETWDLLQELVRTLRQQGAVQMPEAVPSNHEVFEPRLGPIYVREMGSDPKSKILSWLPTRGTNKRIGYVRKVLSSLGHDPDNAPALLKGIWGFLTNPNSPVNWLASSTITNLGVVYQVDHERLRISRVPAGGTIWSCSLCRRTAPGSVRGVCLALGCEGMLVEQVLPRVEDDLDHYRNVYQTMHPVSLTAQEHTAQWVNTEAARIQQDFVKGRVNALSCSTTFELGVDVGELQAVMLRNMPPSTANYLQRAGRAGRRSGAAALVVTYAQRRSHDLTRFAEPEQMIIGEVRAPYVPLTNERIDRRHAQSVAMSAFFRWLFENTGRIDRAAGEFFLETNGNAPSVGLVAGFLDPVPAEITESLKRILPPSVAKEIGVDDGIWATTLVELLETVRLELDGDVQQLEELSENAATQKNYTLAKRYQLVANTLRTRDLLGFLANRNVLPKYGFPVDSVELRTDFGYGKDAGRTLDLTRDLSQAIYEYAPDATIVAGGQLWTSRGIYRVPGRELQEFVYRTCRECDGFWHGFAGIPEVCPHCQTPANGVERKLTIPEFGFVSDREPKRPGPRPPQRSYSGSVHVLAPPPEARNGAFRLPGGLLRTSAGPRGRMVAIADGPAAMGYWICDWCGYAAARAIGENPKKPPKHNHVIRHTPCKGTMRLLDLAYIYETDLLTLDVDIAGFTHGTAAAWKSVLYAVLEAASDVLEIAREDIGGSLSPKGISRWELALFDAVSGGAGHVLQIEADLHRVLTSALGRVSECECGPETSCYGCLRSYGNQREHDELSRGAAQQILHRLLAGTGIIDNMLRVGGTAAPEDVDIPAGWTTAFATVSAEEQAVLEEAAAAGVPQPVIGAESSDGIPIPLAWPNRLTAASTGLSAADIDDLQSDGWTVLPPGPDLWDALTTDEDD